MLDNCMIIDRFDQVSTKAVKKNPTMLVFFLEVFSSFLDNI